MSEPSAYEQYALEIINAQRLDPHAAAAGYGTSTVGITAAQLQPLAFNLLLNDATEDHSEWLLQTNRFSHTGRGNSTTEDRMEAAGYELTGDYATEANLALVRVNGVLDPLSALEDSLEALFLNSTTRGRMLDPQYREAGIGFELGRYRQYNASMLNENFAVSGDNKFITGVIYNDSDGNDKFSYNEGTGGATVRIQPQGGSQEEFTNYATGGYTASTTASGLIDVEFSQNGATVVVTIEMAVDNVKVDLRDSNFIASSASAFLGDGAVGLELLGINDTNATGNDGANILIGNSGDNRISGGEASDTLTGNGGSDTFVFENSHDGVDQITDFVSGTDIIEIGRLGFAHNMQLGQLGEDSLVFGTTATQNQAQFLYDQATGNLSFDMDGTGFGDAVVFANLGVGTALTASDIVITAGGRASGIVNENIVVIENNGAYQLAVDGNGAYLVSNGVGTSVNLKLNTLDVTPTTFAGWSAIQAEATATGLTVLWQDLAGEFVIWQTDTAGNYLDSIGWSSAYIKEIEPLFAADVDGDGQIGAYNLIEDNGAHQLSISELGSYQVSNGVGTPVTLKFNSLDVKPRTFEGWTALQAEATATGFTVLWQAPSGNYTVWQTDAAGNHLNSTSWWPAQVKEIEPSFVADVDGDGQIGAYELIEDDGALQLSIGTLGSYQVSNGVDAPVGLKLNSLDVRPTTFEGWSAVHAEATATGYTVLWQDTGGAYTVWQTDAAGNYLDSRSRSETALNELESVFAVDLNGDGGIGLVEDNGAYKLGVNAEGAYQISNGVDAPVVLKLNSLGVTPTTFDGWSAVQAEATATGFTVLWQDASGAYTVWQIDAAGNYLDSKSRPESALNELESIFAVDLNGDGSIGLIEDNGVYRLSVNTEGAYQISNGADTPITVKLNSQDVTPETFEGLSAVQAEASATGFSVLWQDTSGAYTVWQLDAAGNYLDSKSKPENAVNELESLFSVDLNGDGSIGLIEENGALQLGVNAEGVYEIGNGVDAPVTLKLNSQGVTPATFEGLSAVQAEASATGFSVLWQDASGAYTVWQVDAAGNYLDSKSKPEAALNELESLFAVDLNGDGGIGLVEDNGAYRLGVNAEGAYEISNGVDTEVVLKLNSLDVKPTTFDGWSAIQAEGTATGYSVLWQDSNGAYTIWETDTSGNHATSYGLPEASLVSVETLFAADLNGDGSIGLA